MKFRRKLLLGFALVIVVCVFSVAWMITYFARHNFEQLSKQRSSALASRFEHEFAERKMNVMRRLDSIAASDTAMRMAVAVNREFPDYGAFLNEAKAIADEQQLDFLEFTDEEGTILSSAQWPAKFGYKSPIPVGDTKGVFFRREDLPDGPVLGLCAVRKIAVGEKSLFVTGGKRIDRSFVASLGMPAGMRAFLYEDLRSDSGPPRLLNVLGLAIPIAPVAALIEQIRTDPRENSAVVHWSSNAEDDEMVYATPMFGPDQKLLGALLITDSLRPYFELRRQIRSTALLVGSAGILLAVLLSGWAATRVTKPVDELVMAARKVAEGEWSAKVEVESGDELSELAQSFNRMTRELLEQRERLAQAERVAAWRELARRLAHELKNPLFPLQLTVENLIRARENNPEQFDETFQESASTLLAEIRNLKTIVSRFNEFSQMPQPRFVRVQLNEVLQDCARLFQPQLTANGRARIQCRLQLDPSMDVIAGDPELLHRAFSNLILNAIQAMPEGGTLTLRTRQNGDHTEVEISDSGNGMKAEERDRLFTPYFTSKKDGTGLGLAIVQSIVSDHGGRISVQTTPGEGTTFLVDLPPNLEKLKAGDISRSMTAKEKGAAES
jgi:two-component system, NtrC family, nitrogen regulation sensor histidine kinase NtrY